MATGARPFRGASQGLIFDAILNRAPEPISQVRQGVAEGLEGIIDRCLQKERHLRYQRASELHTDLFASEER